MGKYKYDRGTVQVSYNEYLAHWLAFQGMALEGTVNTLEVITKACVRDTTLDIMSGGGFYQELVGPLSSLEAFEADMSLGSESLIRKNGLKAWGLNPLPEYSELIEAVNAGLALFQEAIATPLPDSWEWGQGQYAPPVIKAHFPEYICITGHQKMFRFTVGSLSQDPAAFGYRYAYPQKVVLDTGKTWTIQGKFSAAASFSEGKDGEGTYVPMYNGQSFTCPSPQQVYDLLEEGMDIQEIIEKFIS